VSLLAGIRVIDLTVAWAGPLAGRWLADLGADVIHVERSTARGIGVALNGDYAPHDADWQWGQLPEPTFRSGIYPDAQPGERPWNRQGIFNKMNRNKRSLCLDLKKAEGLQIFRDLVQVSDIVLDNYRPRALAALGLDYDGFCAINPQIIVVSLSGYGSTGAFRDHVSLGPILEAHSGLAAATGYDGGEAMKLGVALPDAVGGLTGAFAAIAALWQRDLTGRGSFIDVSQFESYTAIGGEQLLAASLTGESPPPHGNRSPVYAPQGVYPCAGEDEWLALSIRSDEEWARFVAMVADEALRSAAFATLPARAAAGDAIDARIAAWTRSVAKHDAMAKLQGAGLAATAVLTNADIVRDPHLAARGFMVEVDQADVGVRAFPGFPAHFSATPRPEMRGAPPLGGDNEQIVGGLLGRDSAVLAQLEREGVLAQRPL
jgi:crotonobetainyl-CoA:carnitine CoA-transferase CaiB-like acyl-CoA transferase